MGERNEDATALADRLKPAPEFKTLRDEFAIAAMALLMVEYEEAYSPQSIADGAYELADAMLEARKVRP